LAKRKKASVEEAAAETEGGEHRSLTRHTVKGVFWITAGRFLKAPLNLLSIAVLARLLTPTDFGIVAIGTIAISLSNVLVDGSFGMVLIQRREVTPKLIGASVVASTGLAIVLAAIIIVSASYIEREFQFPQLRQVLFFLGAVLPVTAVTMVTTALLQRALQFRILTLIAFSSQLTFTTLSIALAASGAGLWSLVWAQMVAFVIEASLGFLAVRKRYRVRFSASALHDVLKSGGMFTVSRLLNLAANNADKVVIGRYLGAAQLGFYTRAATLMTTARDLTGAGPVRVLFSSFAKMQHDPPRMAKAYLRALSVSVIIAAMGSAFIVFNSELIVRILLGPKWLATVPIMQILFAAFIARSGYAVAEAVPLSLGLSGQSAIRQGAQLILIVTGAVIGSNFGILGTVAGIFIAYWIFYFLCLLLVQRLLPVGWMDLLRVHLNGIILAVPPTLAALAAGLLITRDTLLLEFVPAAIFGVVAITVLLMAPSKLAGDDIVKARSYAWERLQRRFTGDASRPGAEPS
jgi:PST family polysaccharide transporter